jgi:hypothetical protein
MIDWQNDDGVNLPMICDFMRNQFYEDIIANNVQGKTVLDVGFGTGLLSIIALKHGAKQVIAYERNKARYELGLDIIERCNLQDKIKLLNKKFRAPCISDHSIDVIVTETVGQNLWEEGMWKNIPHSSGPLILPGIYFCEIYTKPIPKIFAERLGIAWQSEKFFNPGIDIDQKFVDAVNNKISDWRGEQVDLPQARQILTGINTFASNIHTVWGWHPWLKSVMHNNYLNTSTIVDANKLTLNNNPIDYEMDTITMNISICPDDYTLVVPRMGLQHKDHKLYLDTACWGPTQEAIICKGISKLSMTHSNRTGEIEYDPIC